MELLICETTSQTSRWLRLWVTVWFEFNAKSLFLFLKLMNLLFNFADLIIPLSALSIDQSWVGETSSFYMYTSAWSCFKTLNSTDWGFSSCDSFFLEYRWSVLIQNWWILSSFSMQSKTWTFATIQTFTSFLDLVVRLICFTKTGKNMLDFAVYFINILHTMLSNF